MKLQNLVLVLFVSLISFTSCKKEEEVSAELEKKVTDVSSTYTGAMNSDGTQSLNYEVTVTKTAASKIKIKGEDNSFSEFEVTMSESDNSYLNGDKGQVVFSQVDGVMHLSFNYEGAQFVGTSN